MHQLKAVILTLGNEITDGQIQNTNSARLAQMAVDAGYHVLSHLSVPDDDRLIASALQFSYAHLNASDLLIVAGGLGPTSDDRTRKAISVHTGCELEFDPREWERIKTLIQARGRTVSENQKNQAYSPKGFVWLANPEGTASGFQGFTQEKINILVLPGPPIEIEAILGGQLPQSLIVNPETVLLKFLTLGRGEGILAQEFEDWCSGWFERKSLRLVQGIMHIGYRAHFPYVEIKLFFQKTFIESQVGAEFKHDMIDRFRTHNTLAGFNLETATQRLQFCLAKLLRKAGHSQLWIEDQVTRALLLRDLIELAPIPKEDFEIVSKAELGKCPHLNVQRTSDSTVKWSLDLCRSGSDVNTEEFELDKIPSHLKRGRRERYICEHVKLAILAKLERVVEC